MYQQAYQAIKQDILTGHFSPGSKLIESALAEKLQISRTPLREALRQLQQEGLLIYENMNATIVELNLKDIEELLFCRMVLEREVIKLVVEGVTEQQMEQIERSFRDAEWHYTKGDYLNVLEYNSKFHESLAAACNNGRLIKLLQHTRSLLLLYRAGVLKYYENYPEIIDELRNVYLAVKKRDKMKAVQAVEAHFMADLERGKQIWKG